MALVCVSPWRLCFAVPVRYRPFFPQAIKTTTTISKGLADLGRLLTVNPPDITPILPEISTSMTVDRPPNRMDTITFELSQISPRLEQLGRRYGARRSKIRTPQKTTVPKGRHSCRLSPLIR